MGRKIMKMNLGSKGRGRPRVSWKDCLQKDMKKKDNYESEAVDRLEWRREIHNSIFEKDLM